MHFFVAKLGEGEVAWGQRLNDGAIGYGVAEFL